MTQQNEILSGAERDVLRQCAKDAVWDGDIASKVGRDSLSRKGLVWHSDGYSYITEAGRKVLETLPPVGRREG